MWSIGNMTFAGTGLTAPGTHNFLPQSVNFERASDKVDIQGIGGRVEAQIFCKFMKRLSLNVIPCSVSGTNTLANAQASADAWVPKPGLSVTVTDDITTLHDPATYNVYNVIRASRRQGVGEVASVDMELEASDEDVQLGVSIS